MALLALIFVFGFSLFSVGSVQSGGSESYEAGWTVNGVSLRVKSLRPLVITGRGFEPAERVRITGAGTKNITATRAGAFTIRMGRPPCSAFTIVARGSAGSRASVNFANVQNVHCLD